LITDENGGKTTNSQTKKPDTEGHRLKKKQNKTKQQAAHADEGLKLKT